MSGEDDERGRARLMRRRLSWMRPRTVAPRPVARRAWRVAWGVLAGLLTAAAVVGVLAGPPAAPAGDVPQVRAASRPAVLQAVTSTTILQDLVRQVAGERWAVASLLPPGADPHAYQPTPGDARRLSSAKLVVMVGAGLEPPALERFIRSAAREAQVVAVAPVAALSREELEARAYLAQSPSARDASHDGRSEAEQGHAHEGELDPHVWWSVPRTIRIVRGTLHQT